MNKARTDLKAIFEEIMEHRKQSGAAGNEEDWTFGAQVGPTALDSHLLPFVLRLIECDNAELIPQELQRWAGAPMMMMLVMMPSRAVDGGTEQAPPPG